MDVRSYVAGRSIRGTTKVGKAQRKYRKKVEMVRACDPKRGTLRRKDGDGNESTGEKEERKT